MFSLQGKVALVTGAGRNIGAGSARMLARQGAAVIVNDHDGARAAETADSITAAGGRAHALAFDVTDREAVDDAVAEAARLAGPIDILVNNAGNAGAGGSMGQVPFAQTPPDVWPAVMAVNLDGMFNCVRAVLGAMIERRWGRIIVHASGAGLTGLDIGVSTYGAAKAGQIGFVRHLAVENAAYGITCNTIAIGLVVERTTGIEHLADAIPIGRLGRPEDVAGLDAYLASDEAAWITGQTIGVNGGAWMN